jgi:2-dehydropantoate 2-reductase
MARIAIVGPGAIGSAIAASLHAGGRHELTLCGRTSAAAGSVEFANGNRVSLPGSVQTDPLAVRAPSDWVLLAVKTYQVAGAAEWLARLCGVGTRVLVLQNGVEQHALVQPLAEGASVVAAVVWFPAEMIGPRSVRVGESPRLLLPDDGPGRAATGLFDGTTVAARSIPDFHAELWRKLCANAVASLMALVQRRAEVFAHADMAAVARALAAECLAVARAEGAQLRDELVEETVQGLVARPAMGTSILTDRLGGRQLEWDARNGVIARLGAVHGIPTPVSDVIVTLLSCCDPVPAPPTPVPDARA